MMIRLLIFLASLFLFGACASSESVSGTRAERVVSEIHDPASKKVLVASHRGDWRNYPENSLPAIRSAIEMGVDIVEIDLALTSDSVLVLCHDRTIDRTTSGRGLIAEITYIGKYPRSKRCSYYAKTKLSSISTKDFNITG